MRKPRFSWRSIPALLAVALYVALGVSAAWHAPHFSQGEAAVHTDRHADGHEMPSGEDCALGAWKTLSQEESSFRVHAPQAQSVGLAQRPLTKHPAGVLAHVAPARAPPALS